jgi:hypothetical protein
MSVGLILFEALCQAADAVDTQRQQYDPCSQEWLALTQMVDQIDAVIDALVTSAPLEEPA